LETYTMKIQIESRIMFDLAQNHIIPAAIKYQNGLIQNVQGLNDVLGSAGKAASVTQVGLITEISEHVNGIKENIDKMLLARKEANVIQEPRAKAIAYCDDVKVLFDVIRYHVDKLELLVADEIWPLPKYREMLFTR
jgi:glutamine synthetase